MEKTAVHENIYKYSTSYGLPVMYIKKQDMRSFYFYILVNYGSQELEYINLNNNNHMYITPGTAHFLEHKIFESGEKNTFEAFSRGGASVNAYTGFSSTVYYFSCTRNIIENIRLMMETISHTYINEETVEKEKGIIIQEIKMYYDNPGWRTYNCFLNSLYENNTIKYDVAGSIKDVESITPQQLLRVYEDFYTADNMMVFAIGGIDEQDVYKALESSDYITNSRFQIERIYPKERESVINQFHTESMNVGEKLFAMGYKESPVNNRSEAMIKQIMYEVVMDYIMGPISGLYDRLYSKGLINGSFGYGFNSGLQFAYSIASGSSKNPDDVRKALLEEVQHVKAIGIDEKMFLSIKKKIWGEAIRIMDRDENFIREVIAYSNKKQDWFEALKLLDSIEQNNVNRILNDIMKQECFCMSVTVPL